VRYNKAFLERTKMMKYLNKSLSEVKPMYQAYNEAVIELAEQNENIVVLYADFPSDSVGELFKKKYPKRIYDFGIAEANMITVAAGLAAGGKIPLTHCHGIFALGRAYNQIRQNVAFDKSNVKIVLCNSGMLWTFMGGSHQVIEDIAALRAIPNLVIISPADAVETKKVTKEAVNYVGPVALRLANPSTPVIFKEDYPFRFGKATVLREGKDLTIISTGILVVESLKAADILAGQGFNTRLLDVHTIKPIDQDTVLRAARETGAIVTVEDGNILGGLGGAVAEIVGEHFPVPIQRVGVRDIFGRSGTIEEIKTAYQLSAPFIVNAAQQAMNQKRDLTTNKRKKIKSHQTQP